MSNLILYKASAGSGKTYILTREYILLLFKEPLKYRHILAVTFTNKAANEMKSRIVKELYALTRGSSSSFFEFLKQETKFSESAINDKAKQILSLVLHDYSRFSVGTIDAFFQSVIRSFTREIGICNNYDIELDDSVILSEAINLMIDGLDENVTLKNWLALFAEEKIQEGKSWKLHKDITDLGAELFKEKYKQHLKKAEFKNIGHDFIKAYLGELRKIRNSYEVRMQTMAAEALQVIAEYNLEMSDFKGKSTSFVNTLQKIVSGKEFSKLNSIIKAADTVDNWYLPKSSAEQIIKELYNNGLNSRLVELLDFVKTNSMDYNTAGVIQKNLYTLGILNDLQKQIQDYQSSNDIFLISDSSYLLKRIIDGSDTPFIYEKTGSNYNHYFIDEFQDTSAFQWDSFKPLIENSLASGYKNFVVGDTKQSIYRWRNSNWKLIAEQVEKEFVQRIEPKTLATNWRSAKPVIEFNNEVFDVVSKFLVNQFTDQLGEVADQSLVAKNVSLLEKAYADLKQEFPHETTSGSGYVNVTFINIKDANQEFAIEDIVDGNDDNSLKKLPELIKNLQDQGYKAGEIAILVRNKKEGSRIAESLLEYKESLTEVDAKQYVFDIISNDSLVISNSSVVNFIIATLTYINDYKDDINRALLVNEYMQYLEGNTSVINTFDGMSTLKPGLDELKEKARNFSLYELVETIISKFSLYRYTFETAYILTLLDMVMDFSTHHGSGIEAFMEWWEESGKNKTLNLPSDQDAIKILTIHKAKGLEFKTVIIPFCNWKLDSAGNNNIMWCKPDKEPFNKLDLVPVRYSKALQQTIFCEDYIDEKLQQYVDNLNLLYVAFTRARNYLYVMCPISDIDKKNQQTISDVLYQALHTDSVNLPGKEWDDEKLCYSYGKLTTSMVKEVKGELSDDKTVDLKFQTSGHLQKQLRIRYDHEGMFGNADNDISQTSLNRGKLMHRILAGIKTQEDIQAVVEKNVEEGYIERSESDPLKERIKILLAKPEVSVWFDASSQVLTEKDVLLPDNRFKRPDRVVINGDKAVVIDYKIGISESEEHKTQVLEYMHYLQLMEYKDVEGYLWYVELDKINRV